jgi:hypothetical protein
LSKDFRTTTENRTETNNQAVFYIVVAAGGVIIWTVFCSDCGAFFVSIYEITGCSDISISYTQPSSESGPIYMYIIALFDEQARTGM